MPLLSIIDKRFTSATISSGGGNGSTSLTLASAPTGLQPNQHIWLNGGSNSEDNFVASNYVPGSTTVPVSAPVGMYVFDAPALLGIVIQGNALHPAMTVFYT